MIIFMMAYIWLHKVREWEVKCHEEHVIYSLLHAKKKHKASILISETLQIETYHFIISSNTIGRLHLVLKYVQ